MGVGLGKGRGLGKRGGCYGRKEAGLRAEGGGERLGCDEWAGLWQEGAELLCKGQKAGGVSTGRGGATAGCVLGRCRRSSMQRGRG